MKLLLAFAFGLITSLSAFAADDPTLQAVNNDRVSVAICNQECLERLGLGQTSNNTCPPGGLCPEIIPVNSSANDLQGGSQATLPMTPWSGSRHRAHDLHVEKTR